MVLHTKQHPTQAAAGTSSIARTKKAACQALAAAGQLICAGRQHMCLMMYLDCSNHINQVYDVHNMQLSFISTVHGICCQCSHGHMRMQPVIACRVTPSGKRVCTPQQPCTLCIVLEQGQIYHVLGVNVQKHGVCPWRGHVVLEDSLLQAA